MGMDVYGISPTKEKGEYFRNNVWWWRPLWDYCEEVYPPCQDVSGQTNDGEGLDSEQARELGGILLREISLGNTKRYEDERNARLEALPLKDCGFCNGVGMVQVKEGWPDYVEGEVTFRDPCNSCQGTTKEEPFEKMYPFSVENVQEFAEFCIDSGGFQIC